MFIKFHKMREDRDERGFTLIELLVVILIIAILAAIAIPAFLNQRKKGWQAASESALKNAATAMESYAVGKGGDYTGTTLAHLQTEGYNPSTSVIVAVGSADATSYCLTADHRQLTSGDNSIDYVYRSAEGKPVPATGC